MRARKSFSFRTFTARDAAACVFLAAAGAAARRAGIPIVIQEQNALPGLANKVAARFASAVLTSFPDTRLPGARFEGLPVRAAIADRVPTAPTVAP